MDELICRSLHRRTSEAEEAQLLSWRRASGRNERYFRELAHVLTEAKTDDAPAPPSEVPPVSTLIQRVGRRASGRAEEGWHRRFVRRGRVIQGVLAAAAAFTALFLGARALQGPAPAPFDMGTGEVVTGVAETTTIRLGDGSVVRLAPESRIRFTSKPRTREVWLEGRAYFAVAKHPGYPFRVRTHAGDALVLGTRFDLQARGEDLRVLVVDGEVQVAAQGETLDVTASQAARAAPSQSPVREQINPRALEQELEWLGNFLVFEETPLRQVALELSHHYEIPVEVLDEEVAAKTVSGMFSEDSIEAVLSVVCRAVSAHCSIHPSRVTIGP